MSDTKLVKKTEEKDLQLSPAELIKTAIEGKADLEKLEKLLDLQLRWEANEAKKAFVVAMAAFKANPPKIDKDRTVSFKTNAGQTSYKHASLYNVTEKINSALSQYGLSASWMTKQNGSVSVTCKITHIKGYSEETTLSAPSDTSGSKNAIQAIGSTITYLERYTLLALCGLATEDMDDDGQTSGTRGEYITDEQKSIILDIIADKEADLPKFLAYMKIESLEKMPTEKYAQAIKALDAKKKVAK